MTMQLFQDIVVNGETIPFTVVAAEAQNHSGPRGVPGTAWRKAADAIAIRTVLLQEAARRQLRPAPQEVAPGQMETDEEALIRQLLDDAVDVAPPEEAAVRLEWEKDPSRFRSPPLWDVSHILFGFDTDNAVQREAAYARACDIARTLSSDPAQFASVAEQLSDCPSKSAGGYLGQMRPGDMVPEFEEALRTMAPGQISTSPVVSRYGCHVIRLEAAAEEQVLPYEAVRDTLSDAMEKAAWARTARDYVRGLVEASEISGAALAPR